MTRSSRHPVLTAVAPAILLACGPSLIPVPDEEPFEQVSPGLAFGMYAADFEKARPDFYLSDDGTYGELGVIREYSYLFVPKPDSLPPPPTARLAGVESRTEFFDTLRMWPEWHRLVEAYAHASGTPPRCSVFGSLRITLTRATFDALIERRVTAEIVRHPDGQAFEAFLIARAGIGAIEEESVATGDWTPVACDGPPAVPTSRPR